MTNRRWPRCKSDSKRRWLARFRLGKFIPYVVLDEHPDLAYRLSPITYEPYIDAFRMIGSGDRPNWDIAAVPHARLAS